MAAQSADSGAATTTAPDNSSAAGEQIVPQLAPGQVFGPYRIERLLGKGGMGEVYEAEHLEHGRHVALKVVNRRLADSSDRARFLREGELAASVNHPNSVYVFGSEEILGAPVITMELLPGGTLKDRVERDGPLPPIAAVDAILQVIAGLDAAHQCGVLHRDVKPSNCFVDLDGTVKIGDFGLSISTLARHRDATTESGVIQGTPQFAAPEQLTGRPLDTRADIYAVGATLFFLLTGEAPFTASNLGALLARVLTEPAPSARAVQPGVPPGLDRLIHRCLAKDPAARPEDYATLYEELRAYSTEATVPAPLPVRLAAGVIDGAVLMVIDFVLLFSADRTTLGPFLWLLIFKTVYYSTLEGVWGASVGKRICGLRVVGFNGVDPPGVPRALVRTLIYTAAWNADTVVSWLESSGKRSALVASFAIFLSYGLLVILFSTARRNNGFATVYDLLTTTRVVMRHPRTSPGSEIEAPLETPLAGTAAFGPYRVIGQLLTNSGRLFVGYDDRLKRRVWIHALAAGAPAVSVARRRITRPGRLRWLNGTRTVDANWDAYEAPDGNALSAISAAPQPWRIVKHWLTRLSQEIEAGFGDGTVPTLSVEAVWITKRGQPILLDFPVQETTTMNAAHTIAAQQFLFDVAECALAHRREADEVRNEPPLPPSVQAMLTRLASAEYETFHDVGAALDAAVRQRDRVSRRRRAASCLLPGLPLAGTMSSIAVALAIFRLMAGTSSDLAAWLDQRAALEPRLETGAESHREALDLYLVGLYGTELRNSKFWDSPEGRDRLSLRPLVQRILETHPAVSSADLARASEYLKGDIQRRQRSSWIDVIDPTSFTRPLLLQLLVIGALAMATTVVTRGGLILRFWGIAVTRRTGVLVSRGRALARTIVGWCPIFLAGAVVFGTSIEPAREAVITTSAVVAWLAGALYAIARPQRGLQDRVAATWLVPR